MTDQPDDNRIRFIDRDREESHGTRQHLEAMVRYLELCMLQSIMLPFDIEQAIRDASQDVHPDAGDDGRD